jgi:hypothetical protein
VSRIKALKDREQFAWLIIIAEQYLIKEVAALFCYAGAPPLTIKNLMPLLKRHYVAVATMNSYFYGNTVAIVDPIKVYLNAFKQNH